MALRLANRESTSIDLGDGDWIKVKKDLSKRDFIRIMEAVPADKIEADDTGKVKFSVSEAMDFQQLLFDLLVMDWSLEEEASVENYLELEREGADKIDSALLAHFTERVNPNKAELGKPSTSRGSRRKG